MAEHPSQSVSLSRPPLASLRERLAQARYQRDWSQQELADLVGTTPLNISRWERGLTTPNPYFRHKLCAVFGLSEIELGLRPDLTSAHAPDEREPQREATPLFDPFLPLPTSVPLVGRADLLTRLKSQLDSTRAIALSALHGLPGVGKTALALELAYDAEVRERYPDGLLWAALGSRPNLPGLLSHWGQLLGIQKDEAGRLHTLEAWQQRLRATIGSRRLLFILDDAWRLEEALACQVGGPQCAYVLTTRLPQLAESFALSAAYTVETLGEEEGLELLRQLAPWAVEQAMEQVRELVRAVGGLPLALSLIGYTLRQQTHDRQPRRLQAVLARLQNELARLRLEQPQASLDRLANDGWEAEGRRSLEVVIRSSAEQLTEPARQAWAALSILPARPHSFSEPTGLAVGGQGVEQLDELSDMGVLQAVGPARYTFHQILADYGRAQLSDREEQEAHRRLIDYSLGFAEEQGDNYVALEQEASVLMAALEACEKRDDLEALLGLILALAPSWEARGNYIQAERWLPRAEEAAQSLGRIRDQARVCLYQAAPLMQQGDYARALSHHERGLVLARRIGDWEIICAALSGTGRVALGYGEYERAEQMLQEGLAFARQHGSALRQAEFLRDLGSVGLVLGNYMNALAYTREGLQLARQAGDNALTCVLLMNMGGARRATGTLTEARSSLEEALALARQQGYRYSEGVVLANLASVVYEQGDYEQTERYAQKGLNLARQFENPMLVGQCLQNLGMIATAWGEYEQAESYLQEGLSVVRQASLPPDQACGKLAFLGAVATAQGKYKQAEDSLQEGLSLSSQFDLPERRYEMVTFLGEVATARGEYEQAEGYLREGLNLAHQLGSRDSISGALLSLGVVATARGEYEQAESYLLDGLNLARQLDKPELVSRALMSLGRVALAQKNDLEAEPSLQEALQLARQIHHRPHLCKVLYQWGVLCLRREQLAQARDAFQEMKAILPREAPLEAARASYGLARVSLGQGHLGEARRLGKEALALLEEIGHVEAAEVRPWLAGLEGE